MKIKKTLLLSLFFINSTAIATQLESVIDAMAIRTSAEHTNNSWEDTLKIKGVKWRWPYFESGAHDSTMVGKGKIGKDRNPNIGATEVGVSGTRTMITSVNISIYNEFVDVKEFGKGELKKIKTSCDDDSASNSSEFYRLEKNGYKPLYISYQSSSGAGGTGSVDFKVAYTQDDILGVGKNSCKVLK